MVCKLARIIIENIKNVSYGEISFKEKDEFLNVTGVYGQNGSGKTTLIDTLEIVKMLFLRQGLTDNEIGMFDLNKIAKISVETEVLDERVIVYEVSLEKYLTETDEFNIRILQESIKTRVLERRKQVREIFKYELNSEELAKFKNNSKIISKDALEIISDISQEKQGSFFFSSNFQKILEHAQFPEELRVVSNHLVEFSKNIRIYTSNYGGLISANIMTPVAVAFKSNDSYIHGLLPFELETNGNYIPKKMLPFYQKTIEQMNMLLPKIIPGLTLDMVERQVRMGMKGEDEIQLEFLAVRNDKKFSLVYESDGVKKIIGLISYFVEVYNNPNIIAAIDELDSGIFEFLLGELIEIMSTGAQGQLIFTSHNLRILEVLDASKVLFSTTNPSNRYTHIRGVKQTNNLRDLYLRAVQLGGEDEELYEGTSMSSMRRALIKAGDSIG